MKSLEPYLSAEDFAKFMTFVKPKIQVPAEYSLVQNYLNPFNPVTTIEYALPEAVKVKAEVYNVLGQVIEVLIDGEQEPGYYQVSWNAFDVASGV